jgi:hypothetical protein
VNQLQCRLPVLHGRLRTAVASGRYSLLIVKHARNGDTHVPSAARLLFVYEVYVVPDDQVVVHAHCRAPQIKACANRRLTRCTFRRYGQLYCCKLLCKRCAVGFSFLSHQIADRRPFKFRDHMDMNMNIRFT